MQASTAPQIRVVEDSTDFGEALCLPEAENAILGAALLYDGVAPVLAAKLTRDAFTSPRRRLVYETIAQLTSQGRTVDATSVASQLRRTGHHREVRWDYLLELCAACYTADPSANIDDVRDASTRRVLIGSLQHCLAALHGGEELASVEAHLDVFKESSGEAIRTLSVEDLSAMPSVDYALEKRIPLGGLTVIYGQPETMKSFAALGIAFCAASAERWCNLKVAAGRALYVAGEGVAGVPARLAAWRSWHANADLGDRFWVIDQPINLLAERDVSGLIEAARQRAASLVVIDTLSRAMPGADENSQRDVSAAIHALDRLRRSTGSTVVVVHHTTKDGEAERGSSVLRGAADAMIKVRRDKKSNTVSLTVDKAKDGARPDTVLCRPVEMAILDGRTSIVLVEREAASPVHLPPSAVEALRVLHSTGPDGLTKVDWRKATITVGSSQFYDGVNLLMRAGAVVLQDDRHVVTDDGIRRIEEAESGASGSSPDDDSRTVTQESGEDPGP